MCSKKHVCIDCVSDTYLREQMKEEAVNCLCDYCKKMNLCESLSSLANRIDPIYREHFRYGMSYPVFHGGRDKPDYTQQGDYPEDIIEMMISPTDTKISSDLCSLLSEMESYDVLKDGADAYYDDSSCYSQHEFGADQHQFMWDMFCENIKHSSRFFSLEAKETLSDVFKGINNYSSRSGKKVVREISDCRIYRARKANSVADIKKISQNPASELAAPPKHLAKNGRMNPVGVSNFYGAFDKETCISELKPAVGETIICGEFNNIKPLKIFDFTILNEIYDELSLFDHSYLEKYSRLKFLRSFEGIISKAFLPNDSELEYLPLQAMTEYLSKYVEGGVDGIIYPSAQREKKTKNIVVFSHINASSGMNIKEVIGEEQKNTIELKFLEGSITVHKIESVQYNLTESTLEHYNMAQRYYSDLDF